MAKLIRMPVATASGGAVAMSFAADPKAKTAPMTDAPVMSPRLRDKLSMPEMARADTGHHCGVVGRLEERVAGGNDDDGCEVTGDAEHRRQYG